MVDAAQSIDGRRAMAGTPASRAQSDGSASVSISGASSDSLDAYAELCGICVFAPAQSAAWIARWVGDMEPDAVVATLKSDGRPVFALALEVTRFGPFRVARFMGGSHANGNFAAADPSWLALATETDMREIIGAISRARPDIDIIALERLLPDFEGLPNPLLTLPHAASPNVALAADLDGGFDALLSRAGGKRKTKKHRAQMRKFEAAGGFRRIEAKTPEESARLLDAFFVMKEFRFKKMGIANVFGDAAIRAFLHRLFAGALAKTPPPFVLHGLEVDGRLRAVTGSSRRGSRLICEFGAIVEDELSHMSPGEFLFYDNIGEACAQGVKFYDFGVGDEPYKRTWCDIETQHADVLTPLSLKGRALAVAMRLRARLKSFVKNSPLIWKMTKALRRRATGQPESSAED